LRPTVKQTALLLRAVGTARFAFNYALAEWQRQYAAGEKPNEAKLRRELNAIKHEKFPWMAEVPKAVVQQAIKNLGRAFTNFFKKRAKYPRFKKRGQHDSARFDNGPGTFTFDDKRIKLPVIGWIKTREALRFNGKPLSATVNRVADRWFVSIPVELEITPAARENQAAVGVDFGLKRFATLSTGEVVEAPKLLQKLLGKLRRLSRSLSRKKRGSANRRKAQQRLARLHARIANARQDFIHKFTTDLVRRFSTIGVEDLNIRGMLRNHCLARAIADVSWSEARRQLGYKSVLTGTELVIHDRWFASSKTCSACGLVLDELPLSVREWTCECGAVHDRDLNAAKNLEPTAASCAVAACGAEGSGPTRKLRAKPAAVKQESMLYRLIQQ
jgi:putative transposase